MNATSSSDLTPASDPTLLVLVPKGSRRRNLILTGFALLTLLAVWASPTVLRPSVVPDDSAGSWSALAPHTEVVTTVRLEARGWPSVSVQDVGNVPGAEVIGAWVVADGDHGFDDELSVSDYASSLDYIRAASLSGRLDAEGRVPVNLATGERAQLITLWAITDCALLIEGERPVVTLRTPLGASVQEPLDDIASPAFHLATLQESGICR